MSVHRTTRHPVPLQAAVLVLSVSALTACASPTATPPDAGTPTTAADATLAQYFITPALCNDGQGPDCTRLRLGNPHLTTSAPAVGKLYSCAPGNPNAPGSITARITWIDHAAGTWNLLRKPFLPAAGSSAFTTGAVHVSESGESRTIQTNSMPVDARIGDWPMPKYAALTAIDRNPGTPAPRVVSLTVPRQPAIAAVPTCVGMGTIGVTLNGVLLYNAVDARGDDAVANEIVDVYGGHPAMSEYHYHNVPERLDASPMADGHSGIIGYIRDGFPLYGYHGVGGIELTNADLDACHGHTHGSLGYHYHATMEYPYTIGCYRGTPR
jgi:hypothetical protein